MSRLLSICFLLSALVLAACEEPKPTMTGRLSGPADLEVFKGCPQKVPGCEQITQSKHLLLVANSLADDLKIFEVEGRGFFKATNPFFPLSIPVGRHPHNLALDPYEEFVFVVNALSEDVSVVNLAPNRLVEVDTDWDTCTSFCGPCKDADDDPVSYSNARCRAGVSRVALGSAEWLQPEDIVTLSPTGAERVPGQPLPVYVSLTGVGQIAVLNFTYPGMYPGYPQRMDLVGVIEVGGQPSGLALTQDGTTLFAADEASDSVIVIDTATRVSDRIPVGGPTRRVFLTPDDSVLYAIRFDEGRVSLVDVATRQKRPPGEVRADAMDPQGNEEDVAVQDLRLPGVPRSLTFSRGVPILIYDDAGSIREYTTELQTTAELEEIRLEDPEYVETIVKTFAYISDLNGNVYIIDAENHRMVDIYPFAGPSTSTAPAFAVDGNVVTEEEWEECYPQVAEIEVVNSADEPQEREIDEELWRVYYGVWVKPGATRDESWLIEWEGILPGTDVSTSGRFAGWRLEDDRYGLDFLDSDVRPGDILEITVDPTFTDDSVGDHPCLPRSGDDEAEKVQYEFVVTAVEEQALELEPSAGMDPEVCWAEALRYNIRAGDAWIVWGSESGFMERLTMVENTGEAPDPPVYNNGRIALTMYEPPAFDPEFPDQPCPAVKRGMAWGFNSEDGFSGASFNPNIQAGISGALVAIDLDDDLEAGNLGDDRIFLLFEGSNAMMEFFPGSLESSNYIIYQ